MPPTRLNLIATSLKLGLESSGRANGSSRASRHRRHHASSFRRLSSNSNSNSNSNVAKHAKRDGDDDERNRKASPTVTGQKEGRISPLIRFESAVIRYPPPTPAAAFDIDDNVEFDHGLNDDCSEMDRDLILESRHSFHDDGDADRRWKTQQRLQRHWNNQQSASASDDDDVTSSHRFDPFDLNIWPNLECGAGGGGHVVLGRNASGKTLLSRSLFRDLPAGDDDPSRGRDVDDDDANPYLRAGRIFANERNPGRNRRNHRFVSHVSFDSHSSLLLDPRATTVHRALIPFGGNRLSPAAKFLSVRLGMFPFLHRRVDTLSTGEVRRVLLVRALVSKPELMVLDNAFDGLDARGREGVQDIIERVLEGFRMDILVQGVGEARDTARTQVLLLTHRPEEIADGMGRVTFVDRMDDGGGVGDGRSRVRTEERLDRDAVDLVKSLMSWEQDDRTKTSNHSNGSDIDSENACSNDCDRLPLHPWDIASEDELPSTAEISDFWEHGKSRNDGNGDAATAALNNDVLVQAKDLTVTRDDATILHHLDWTVQRGERWHLAGFNGAGKSTLARLLLRMSMTNNSDVVELQNSNKNKSDAFISDGTLAVVTASTASLMDARCRRGGISWVSTELHLHAAHNWGGRTVLDIMTYGASFLFYEDKSSRNLTFAVPDGSDGGLLLVDVDIAITAASWLGLFSASHSRSFLSRQFSTLSQGEQKLLLVASAIAQRPSLLVLDEPCQGLDLWNRGHLLGLVERVCRVTDTSLLYVTHHEEELIPSMGYRLCLEDGNVTYNGLI